MPVPAITGSVIVLTHARTGSSLVMQTLRLLGLPVIGSLARHDLPQEANPKGYFEDRDLLRHGLLAPAAAEQPGALAGRGFKMALGPLVRRRSVEEYDALASGAATLLLPIRSPAESLASRDVLLRGDTSAAARARLFRSTARGYLVDIGWLADRVCAHGLPPPACVDYRDAIDDPAGYVAAIARAAALAPGPAAYAAAVANIDRDLYRRRRDDGDAVRAMAQGLGPLEAVHAVLRRSDRRKWADLRQSLPGWALPRATEPDVPDRA